MNLNDVNGSFTICFDFVFFCGPLAFFSHLLKSINSLL